MSLIINIFTSFFLELKNTQDQIIQLQHIIQLLPLINRDTLYVLLQFLGLVAEHAEDRTDESGRTKYVFSMSQFYFYDQILVRIDKFCQYNMRSLFVREDWYDCILFDT